MHIGHCSDWPVQCEHIAKATPNHQSPGTFRGNFITAVVVPPLAAVWAPEGGCEPALEFRHVLSV
eukprot:1158427-Pelagomonas_calceolata.AAC.4